MGGFLSFLLKGREPGNAFGRQAEKETGEKKDYASVALMPMTSPMSTEKKKKGIEETKMAAGSKINAKEK